jgi:hypothetical protein
LSSMVGGFFIPSDPGIPAGLSLIARDPQTRIDLPSEKRPQRGLRIEAV